MFMLDTNVIIYCLRHPEDPINRIVEKHARSLGYTLVTHNTKEFSRVNGLCLEDWQTF